MRNNRYEYCDTAQHVDNRGLNWERAACSCSDLCNPGDGNCGCNTGGARWVLANADPRYGKGGPFGDGVAEAANGVSQCNPFGNIIEGNTYCSCGKFLDMSGDDLARYGSKTGGNKEDNAC